MAWVNISISLKNNTLEACFENGKDPAAIPNPQGIGLKNVRRQLELLYPGRHSLDIADTGDAFRAVLKIALPPTSTQLKTTQP